MGEALRQARETSATVATQPGETLNRPLVVYRIRDRLTGEQRTVRSVTLAVEIDEGTPGSDAVLKDWELLGKLNGLVGGRGFRAKDSVPPPDLARVEEGRTNYDALHQSLEDRPDGGEETVDAFGIPFVGFPVEKRKRARTGKWGEDLHWIEPRSSALNG